MIHPALLALPFLAGQPASAPAAWAFDEVTLKNGAKLSGLILDDSPAGVRFQVVNRHPGRPAVTLTTTLLRAEIAGVKKLADAERAVLRERVAGLDPRSAGEQQRAKALALRPADWLGKPAGAKRYDSDYFTLVSAADEEVVRRAAVRLEQIYTAYARFLPPRRPAGRPTTVFLAEPAEYPALAGPILNPAVFDPGANRIVLRVDLRATAAELTKARLHNLQQAAALDRYEADVRKLYRQPAELDRHLEPVRKGRQQLRAAEAANDAKFDEAARRPFALLYHEAFHAYAGNFVYPPAGADDAAAGKATGELPRWLNEGLAQVFETAVLEAGELRVGHADRDRLEKVQGLLKAGRMVPVADLVRAGKESFLALHADQRAAADRAYLAAWGVAFHLTFDRRLVGTAGFDAYLAAANAGGDPVAAFERLAGQGAADYEAELHAYLARLQPDGTVRK